MKKFFAFLFIIFIFTAITAFIAEKTDILGIRDLPLQSSFAEHDGHIVLAWEPMPYPCYYKVETYAPTTGLVDGEPEKRLIESHYTAGSTYEVPSTAIPNEYQVTAYGMFGALTNPSAPIANPVYAKNSPTPIYHYTEDNPASVMPFLVWHSFPNAVCYEVELLSGPPDNEGGTADSVSNHLESTNQIFTNGWQADLKKYAQRKFIYWRVRALDIHHKPIGEFSPAEPLYINPDLAVPASPLINDFDQMTPFQMPVYPVYQWIPLHDAKLYEVEVLTEPPAAEQDTQPSPDRFWHKTVNNAAACYDEYARPYAGDYYWRVRAVDKAGHTIGTWSASAHFTMPELPARVPVAVLGDSITHGGGAVSNSPAALEYSYPTYFDFPCINLGRSGDTAQMTLNRFDQDVLPLQPVNLLILTGSNSLRAVNISAESVINDLTAIKKKCQENDIRPVFLTLMPVNPANIQFAFHTGTDPNWALKMHKINSWIRQQEYFIDLEPYFYDPSKKFMDNSFSIDGLHPDIRGKMLMGEIINQHKDVLLLK